MNANLTVNQQRAYVKLAEMRQQLGKWLKAHAVNDKTLTTYDLVDRQQYEPLLAANLTDLLQRLHPEARLPGDVVALAEMTINETVSKEASAPTAQGLWPLIIVAGAIVLALTSVTSTLAGEAPKREESRAHYKCVMEGNCVDYGFWYKWGGIAAGAYVLHKLGVFTEVKRLIGAGGSYTRRRLGVRR